MGDYKLANQMLRALVALGLCFTIVILAGCSPSNSVKDDASEFFGSSEPIKVEIPADKKGKANQLLLAIESYGHRIRIAPAHEYFPRPE